MKMKCRACGHHELRYMLCDRWDCPNLELKMSIEHDVTCGPNDVFEIASNNSPDLEDDDDEVHEPQDYTGDYPLDGDDGGEECDTE